MKSKQKRDTFHDSRLKTWKNAIHSTNCNKKTRKTRCFYTTKFHLHRKITIFKENRWMYRVSWGSRCQTRCKIAIFKENWWMYRVFGGVRCWALSKIAIFDENRWMYRVFRGSRCQTRCKIAISKENRWMYRVSWGSRCQTRCKIAKIDENRWMYRVLWGLRWRTQRMAAATLSTSIENLNPRKLNAFSTTITQHGWHHASGNLQGCLRLLQLSPQALRFWILESWMLSDPILHNVKRRKIK